MIVDTVILKGKKINISSYIKNVNGKSCIYYRARITVDYDPVTRKQKQKSLSGTTIDAVREQIFQLIDPASATPRYQGSLILIKTALPEYVRTRYGGGNSRTFKGRQIQSELLISKLGEESVQKLSQETIQRAVDQLTREYSANTIHGAISLLRLMMEEYVHKQCIPFNPCKDLRLPVIPVSGGIALSHEQLRGLLRSLQDSPYYLFFNVLALTATRVGECRALSWNKIDFLTHRITIDQQIPVNCNTVVTSVKNNNPTSLSYNDAVFDFLQAAYEQQQQYIQLAGSRWSNPDDLVFTTPTGAPLPYLDLLKEFKKAAASIQVPELRMHDLRHTYASLLWEETHRIDLASMILKHKTALTTRKYIHPTPKTYEECRLLMDKVSRHILNVLKLTDSEHDLPGEESSGKTDLSNRACPPDKAAPDDGTVSSLLDRFLGDLIRRGLSNSSYHIAHSILVHWVFPVFGNKKFDAVDASDVDRLVRKIKEKPCSLSYSRTILGYAKSYFNFAIRMEAATRTPIDNPKKYFPDI